MDFFPAIPKNVDLTTFDAKGFMNANWWAQVEANAQGQSKDQQKYFKSVEESFELFGDSVRNVVRTELKKR